MLELKFITFIMCILSIVYILWCTRRYDVIDEKTSRTEKDIEQMIKLSKKCDISILVFLLSLGALMLLGIFEIIMWII